MLDGADAKVTAVARDAVRLSGGRELPSQVTIWTAGFGVPDLARRSGLSTDALGRLLTDETLTSVDDVRIVAAGDSAAPSDLPLRMSCPCAGPLGAHAADTVLSRIAGEQPAFINVGFFGLCVSLGRRAATVRPASKDDTANRFSIGGRLAVKIKESGYKGLIKHLADEARKPGSHTWSFKDDKRRQLLRAKRGEAPATAERAAWPGIRGRSGRLSTDLDCMSCGGAPYCGAPPHACVHRRSSEPRIVVNVACHSRAPGGVPLSIAPDRRVRSNGCQRKRTLPWMRA